jgi:GTP cyclohydrolase I
MSGTTRNPRPSGRGGSQLAPVATDLLPFSAHTIMMVVGEHLCMTVRGVQAPGVRTVTSALRGRVRDDPRPGPSSSPWPRP